MTADALGEGFELREIVGVEAYLDGGEVWWVRFDSFCLLLSDHASLLWLMLRFEGLGALQARVAPSSSISGDAQDFRAERRKVNAAITFLIGAGAGGSGRDVTVTRSRSQNTP